jgi:circadian clock protein KaiB
MSGPTFYKFRLYVAGEGPHSLQAIANLQAICSEYLEGRHEIELIDVFADPDRALADHVILTPLLMKLSPGPLRKLVGTLGQRTSVLIALGIGER